MRIKISLILLIVLGLVGIPGITSSSIWAQNNTPGTNRTERPLKKVRRLHQQANELYKQGKFEQGILLEKQALEILRAALGEEHLTVATYLHYLALLYESQDRYSDAKPLYKQSLEIRRTLLGKDHPDFAIYLNELAARHNDQGRYGEAEPLYKQSLEILRTTLGENHPDFSISLNNLAQLYKYQGRYGEAEALYKQSLEITRMVLGEDHPNFAVLLNNLAELYKDRGRYSEAEPLFKQAVANERTAQGEDDGRLGIYLNNLAEVYRAQDRYSEAEPLYKQSLAIFRTVHGENHPNTAISLNNLAKLYQFQGRYSEAEPLYKQVLAIARAAALGKDHPNVAAYLNNLADLYWGQNLGLQALPLLSQSLRIEEVNLTSNLAVGNESQKRAFLDKFQGSTDAAISAHHQLMPTNPQAQALALTTILRRKGRILEVLNQTRQRLRRMGSTKILAKLDQLESLYQKRTHLESQGPGNQPLDQYRQRANTQQTKINQLETDLSRLDADLNRQFNPVQLQQVQQAIPNNATLIEFILYRPVNPKAKRQDRYGELRYAAYTLSPNGKIQSIDLGLAQELDPLITNFHRVLKDPSAFSANVQRSAYLLYQKLFQPLVPLIGNAEHLLISPDSQLNLIPFGALVDAQDQYLVQAYQFTYLSSGRDLLRLDDTPPAVQAPLILASPAYGQPQTPKQQRSGGLADLTFPPLPHTLSEGQAIAPLVPRSRLLTGPAANETNLKASDNVGLLHVATHGFFLADSDPSEERSVHSLLLRSGLALAGANHRHQNTQKDGVLSALEVTGLDLRATQLVTLSACDTGLGDIANGEGVYGLRRAFTLAGAQSQVMSLWRADDASTQRLMTNFYQRLRQNQGRGAALRQVQLDMLNGNLTNDEGHTYTHPYFWALFIHTGDWRPMNVK